MLMVLSIPAEYKRELQFESRASGKSVSQIVKEIFANRFAIKTKTSDVDALEKMFSLAKTMPHADKHEKWTRDEIYDRGL